jgi:tetratricopeptide (TPR) repeat protein
MTVANSSFPKAGKVYDLGRYEEAKQLALEGLKQNAEDVYCHFILALCAARNGRKKTAGEHLAAASRLTGGTPDFHYYSAQCELMGGSRDTAETQIKKALNLAPECASYHSYYAVILKAKHKPAMALQEIEIALSLGPNSEFAVRTKAELLLILGRRSEAEALSRTVLSQTPDASLTHSTAGRVALGQGRVDDAFKNFREALRINPNSVIAQEGVKDALRSRSRIYRWYYAFNLWLASKPVGILGVGFYVCFAAVHVLSQVELSKPVIVLMVLLTAVVTVVVLFSLFAKQIGEIMLLFHPLGRLLLDAHVKAETAWFATCLALMMLSIVGMNINHQAYWWIIILACALSCYFMSLLNRASERGPVRWSMFGMFVALGLGAMSCVFLR